MANVGSVRCQRGHRVSRCGVVCLPHKLVLQQHFAVGVSVGRLILCVSRVLHPYLLSVWVVF